MFPICIILAAFATNFVQLSAGDVTDTEGRLITNLLANYSKLARPTGQHNQTTVITVDFNLQRIDKLDERHQVLTTYGCLVCNWIDRRLGWNPMDYTWSGDGGSTNPVMRVVVPDNLIWLPEIQIMNGLYSGGDISFDHVNRVSIYPHGMVLWAPCMQWKTSCQLAIERFPFDTHTCNVSFVSVASSMSYLDAPQLVFTTSFSHVMQEDLTSPEWQILENRSYAAVSNTHLGSISTLSRVWFTLKIKRKSLVQEWNVLAPTLLMTIMSLYVFILPSESGEKIGLAVTVVLSYSVTLLMMSDITPKSGDSVPFLSKYIVVNMGFTALCLLFTIVVLWIHHHSPDSPVPHILNVVIMRWTATILCLRKKHLDHKQKTIVHPKLANEELLSRTSVVDLKERNASFLPAEILEFLEQKIADARKDETIEDNRAQWEHLANIVNRAFFVASLLGICIVIVFYFNHIFGWFPA